MNILESGIIAIIRSKSEIEGRELARALVDAGVKSLEVTTTTPGVFTLIKELAADNSLHVGVGTTMTSEHVKQAHDAGAQYAISPHTDARIIKATKEIGMLSIPGVATATDVAIANATGADILKLFPASTYGPKHLKALIDPFPGLKWVATGGITVETVESWFLAGVSGLGLGGPITGGGPSEVAKRLAEFKAVIAKARVQ